MFEGSAIFLIALVYVSALFAIAWAGDRYVKDGIDGPGRPLIYALSIAIYCTTWTVMGSVGTAATTGWGFIPVYLGPILMFVFGWPLITRIVRIAKSQNITSIADFMASRYGKSPTVAAVVAGIAVVGAVPYIALQLKAIMISVDALMADPTASQFPPQLFGMLGSHTTAFIFAVGLSLFAVLFGTRHIDATEHQFGLMLAISAESVVKLTAFLIVGIYVVVVMFGGPVTFWETVKANPQVEAVFSQPPDGMYLVTVTFLASCCILLLPRQFHVTVVENRSQSEIKRAAWLFPTYLVLINLFVVPIAAAGLLLLPDAANPDLFVILVPMAGGSEIVAATAFIGALSAATAMVVVEAIAVAILICNGVIVPALLRNRMLTQADSGEIGSLLLMIRRAAIVGVILLAFLFERALGDVAGLSAIGLVAFAAVAQIAPAFFLGLFWRNGTARGVVAGIAAGSAVWAYTLLLPWVVKAGFLPQDLLSDGPFGLGFLKPQALFYVAFDPLTHGVFWSILVNTAAFVLVSRRAAPDPLERMQSEIFASERVPAPTGEAAFKVWRSAATVGDLRMTVARYLGAERADRSFREYYTARGEAVPDHVQADVPTLRFAERLLASAIGAASSRLVLSLLLRRDDFGNRSTLKLLDDASEALQHNRDLLQSAIDQVRHGLVVFDTEMRLICWNRRFREILDLPPEFGRVGVPLDRIIREMAKRGDFGEGDIEEIVADRVMRLAVTRETFQEKLAASGRFLEIRTAAMPQGGIVTTFADITQRVSVANALAEINVTLERRVEERTAELLSLNAALAVAKTRADTANQDKTRFVAAATHDILQPLNAARLYAISLVERDIDPELAKIASNIDVSLRAVEEIFGAIMEISRIDAGRTEPTMEPVPLQELFDNIKIEFEPAARERGLRLTVQPTSKWVRSDRRMLRRLVQNLVSNAIKYTDAGRVVVGAKQSGDAVRIIVADTGPGIADEHKQLIFKEFQRIDGRTGNARGLGLGLSIVERLSHLLNADVRLVSKLGAGSMFWVSAPQAEPVANSVIERAQPKTAVDGALVVCVDNEPAILEGMKTLLTNWGCEVVAASDESGALRQLADVDGVPSVIFADYHLDDDTGDNVIANLRAHYGAEIPGVIITADHSDERETSVRAQGLALLRKPVKAAAMRALLNQYARQRQAAE
jgi:Na+/proline symporter/signal transduction histidine kinase